MKKFMERMAQIAYSINLVNGFDTEVEVFACAENCWANQSHGPCIQTDAGAFLCLFIRKNSAAEMTSLPALFFCIELEKGVD